MFVIRNTFVAKPGSASKLAAQLKEAVTAQRRREREGVVASQLHDSCTTASQQN